MYLPLHLIGIILTIGDKVTSLEERVLPGTNTSTWDGPYTIHNGTADWIPNGTTQQITWNVSSLSGNYVLRFECAHTGSTNGYESRSGYQGNIVFNP